MKIYCYSKNSDDIHLADILKRVVYINIVDDAVHTPCSFGYKRPIHANESMDDYMLDDDLVFTFTDEQILDMYEDDTYKAQMKLLEKPALLARIYRLCPEKLTGPQIATVSKYFNTQKIEVADHDVEILLAKIRQCTRINFNLRHEKSLPYIFDAEGKPREAEVKALLDTLTVENRIDQMLSGDPQYMGDILVVFSKWSDWKLSDGTPTGYIDIYIKIDMDQTTGNSVVEVTFHKSDLDTSAHQDSLIPTGKPVGVVRVG